MSRLDRRGFSMIELLVACSLLLLATGIMASFFAYFSRQSMRYHTRQELVVQAERALFRLHRGLAHTTINGLVLEPTLPGLRFPVAQSAAHGSLVYDQNGALVWQAWQAFGHERRSLEIWQSQQPLAVPTRELSEVLKAPLTAVSTWPRRRLASQVESLECTLPAQRTVRVQIVMRDTFGFRLQFSSAVEVQN